MEYYDYKDYFINDDTTNSTLTNEDQVIIISIATSFGGIFFFILACCCCSASCAGYVDKFINDSLSGGDAEYGDRALRRMEAEKEKNKEDPEERKEKLLKSIQRNKVSMVVTEDSFVRKQNEDTGEETALESTTTSSTTSDDDSDNGQIEDDESSSNHATIVNVSTVLQDIESGVAEEIYLPPLKNTKLSKNGQGSKRTIPNCCAICLCPYDVDDTIIWSCSNECNHAFHDECIIPWLVKNQNGECPCCRGQFTDLPPPKGSQSSNDNDRASFWSIRSWRLNYSFLSQRE
jgi:hypothetical protein